ncbi:MAG: extracellular solute-binding protein [Bifidobacteriaceae bacterium]|nr:extracellular solute-binding protein [Bifidobacteriaceae bacterium]
MKKTTGLAALAAIAALTLAGCGTPEENAGTGGGKGGAAGAGDTELTLWLAGGDTGDDLRDYLKSEFEKENKGWTLKIETIDWGDLVTKLNTAMPDAKNTPDVVEVGNTQSPTFTNVGAFLDISDMYEELGGDDLLQSFVEVGEVDGKNYTLPYYFGSRYMFYRVDVWQEAGLEVPNTLDEFNTAVVTLTEKNPRAIKDFSGLFLGGADWRNGISWVFANGGDLAKQEDGAWVSTLSDPNTIKGLKQLQIIQQKASMAPVDAKDQSPWLYINDTDEASEEDSSVTSTSLSAATIMAPGWAHWSIGDPVIGEDGQPERNPDGVIIREWNPAKFGVFALPGNDGKPAPVFAGGSNIGISAKSQHPEQAKSLMKIIFSDEYQQMLGGAGLGPANSQFVDSLGTDEFAKALIDSALNSKLTPAAPGWAAVEASGNLEEFFGKIAQGGDVEELAREYDQKITPLLQG